MIFKPKPKRTRYTGRWKATFVICRICRFDSKNRRLVIWHDMETRYEAGIGQVYREPKGS